MTCYIPSCRVSNRRESISNSAKQLISDSNQWLHLLHSLTINLKRLMLSFTQTDTYTPKKSPLKTRKSLWESCILRFSYFSRNTISRSHHLCNHKFEVLKVQKETSEFYRTDVVQMSVNALSREKTLRKRHYKPVIPLNHHRAPFICENKMNCGILEVELKFVHRKIQQFIILRFKLFCDAGRCVAYVLSLAVLKYFGSACIFTSTHFHHFS